MKSKRILSTLLAVIMIVGILPISTLTAFAADGDTFTVDGFTYKVTDELAREVSLIDAANAVGDCVIPQSVNGYNVSVIEYMAFYECTGLTGITLPDTVYSIGASAFAYCSNLTSIKFPDRLYNIGANAFFKCTKLAEINLPNGLSRIDQYAFSYCSALKTVNIPSNVSSIGVCAFEYCTELTEITISEGVRELGDAVFYDCAKLTHITIPGSVTKLGAQMFSGCSSLETVLIMEGQPKTIHDAAFQQVDGEPISATVTYQYVTPSNLRWEDTTLRWDGVNSGYVRYKIDLSWEMDSGINPIRPKAFYVTDSFCDLSEYMGQKGTYNVEVTAVLPEIIDNSKPRYQDSGTASIETKYPFQVESSNVQATRVDRNTGKVSFTTSMAGTMYYFLSDMRYIQAPSVDTSGEGVAVRKGNYEFSLPVNGGIHPQLPQYLYVTFKTADGVVSDVECIEIPGMDEYYYTVKATAGEGGSISPVIEYVKEGDSLTLTITPNEGYELATLTVDGIDVTDDVVGNQYTVSGIEKDKTVAVAATFRLIPPAHTHCICGGSTAIGDHAAHSDVSFTYWYDNNALPTASGNYVLATDVTISGDVWRFSGVDVTICLNGHTITRDAENKGLIDVVADTTLNICDCAGGGAIKGNKNGDTYNSKSGLYVEGTGVINLFGGTIADGGNSGVVTRDGGTFNMYGGEISGNYRSDYGGGVRIEDGSFTMYGGAIRNNTAGERGGGVYVSGNGTFDMRGGIITGNTAGTSSNSYGGGVFVYNGGTMTVSGASVITGNTAQSTESNLHLQYSQDTQAVVNVGELTEGADIGISMYEYGVFSVGGADYAKYFTVDNSDYIVLIDGNNLKLVESKPVQVGGVELADGEYTTNGTSKTAGEPAGTGYAYYKNGVLTLNNFTYSGGGSNGSVIYATTDLTIHAVGNNTIDSSEKYAVHLNGGNLTITGDVLNLTVSNSANADTAVLLFDFAGAYGSLTMSDVTLNVQYAEVSERKTYGISCGNVIIDNTALTVDMHVSEGAMMCTGDGLRSYGTVEIKNNSRVIIDLSEGVESTGLRVEDANISISDSYVELRGNGAYGIGLAFNTSYKTLDFNSGTLIIAGAHNTNGAAYMYNATLELPVGDYWWRTDENGSYSKGDYTYNKNQTYIEITTSKPQNEWVSTPTISGWVYGQEKGTPQAEAKYGTVEFEYYNEDKIVLGELPDNAGTYYLKGFVFETNNYTGLESDYVWFAIEKDEQVVPHTPTGVNTTYIDTNDGKITGVDSTMEYRKEGDTNYTAVTGTEITDLAPGKYYVRYAEKANYNPSPDNEINISEGPKRTATIVITATLDKTYDGSAVTEPAKDSDFAYDGDGTTSVKWYTDNNNTKGDELTEAPKNAGKYWIGVAATEGTTYNAAPEVRKQFEITKATPTITTPPTASRITSGSKLEVSVLSDGVASVDGTFAWETPTKEMTTTGNMLEKVIFTPTDTTNYNTAECDVTVNVYRRSSGGGGTTRYTVKFETNCEQEISSKTVTRNSKLTAPDEPIQEGFIFGGWYTDKELTEKYDFDSKVTKSFTLYAKWEIDEEQTQPIEPTEWENPFIDVNTDDWFYDVVKEAYIKGLIKGTSENTFSPNGDITRGMFVTILYRAEGEPAVNKSIPFADVKADDYFANAVIWAQQNEIVKGISENEFAPNSNITREQMAAILYRYAEYKGYDVSVGEDTNILSYADFDKISEYAIPAMQWACGDKIISGKGDGILDPLGTATRAEAAAVLVRFLEKI